ncbi:MarR family winged helix-turn-helix transcriptional regulator [Kitasatospora phosalacinea]|uniref:MarR family winged helix-turn-helix transcriptional regulator n=1 Tax=Kitasatospora phosalacinea TaxID=2065 RepID=UPI0035DBA9ED
MRHHAILRYLATVDGARQRELADRLGHDPSAIGYLLDDLQQLGLAERRPDPADRRSRLFVLTPAGHTLSPTPSNAPPSTTCSSASPPAEPRPARPTRRLPSAAPSRNPVASPPRAGHNPGEPQRGELVWTCSRVPGAAPS